MKKSATELSIAPFKRYLNSLFSRAIGIVIAISYHFYLFNHFLHLFFQKTQTAWCRCECFAAILVWNDRSTGGPASLSKTSLSFPCHGGGLLHPPIIIFWSKIIFQKYQFWSNMDIQWGYSTIRFLNGWYKTNF